MNRSDVMRAAREAGVHAIEASDALAPFLARFAALVRAQVLEEAAQRAESDEFYGSALQHDIAAAIRGMKSDSGHSTARAGEASTTPAPGSLAWLCEHDRKHNEGLLNIVGSWGEQDHAPKGYKLVMVPELQPQDEPDWDECIRQAEVATGLRVERHTLSIVIREVRRWLAGRQASAPGAAFAAEYQRWIDFYHAGNGDYADFLRATEKERCNG